MTKLSRLRGSEGYAVRANSRVNKLKASRYQFERRGNGASAVFAKRRSLAAETKLSGLCAILRALQKESLRLSF